MRRHRLVLRALPLAAALTWLASSPALAFDPRPAPPGRGLEAVAALTDTLYRQSRFDSIEAVLRPLVAAARARRDHGGLLWLIRRQGEMLLLTGNVPTGLASATEAVSLAEAAHDTLMLMDALRWQDWGFQQLGRFPEAHAAAQRTYDLARRTGNPYYAARAQISFGWEATRAGDMARSYREYQAAAETLRALHHLPDETLALLGASDAAMHMGRLDECQALAQQALQHARSLDHPRYQAWALGNLGMVENRRGDPAAAARVFRDSYETFKRYGFVNNVTYPGRELAYSLTETRRFREVEGLIDTLAFVCTTRGFRDQLGRVYNARGFLRRAEGRNREAANAFRLTLALGDTAQPTDRAQALGGLTVVLQQQDSLDAALTLFDREWPRLEQRLDATTRSYLVRIHASIMLDADRPAAAADQAERQAPEDERVESWRPAAACWLIAARGRLYSGDPARAMALIDQADRCWEVERGASADLEWRESGGGKGVNDIAQTAVGLALDYPVSLSRAERAKAAFERLQHYKTRTLLERVWGPAARHLTQAPVLQPVGLAAFQRDVLKEGDLLLDFLSGDQCTFLFAVTRHECRAVRLPPDTRMARETSLYRDLVSRRPEPGTSQDALSLASAHLGALILGDVADLVGKATRLYVAADGPVQLLPFASLGNPAAARNRLLIDDAEVVSVPSATLLSWARARARTPAGRLLAVASAPRETPAVLEEVRDLGREFVEADVIEPGSGVLPAEVLTRYGALHFAGHTDVDDERPWSTELPALRTSAGRPLAASDVAAMTLPARLAVLSSCESAGGRVLDGEGVAGLSTAFLAAGVPTVVASLWRVDDRATCRLMSAFYAQLGHGRTVGDAIRRAQLALRSDARTSHPYYWAAFVPIGAPDTRLGLRRKPLAGVGATGAAAAVCLLGASTWAWVGWRRTGPKEDAA